MRPAGKSPNPKAKKTPKKSQPKKAQETAAKKVQPPTPTVTDSEEEPDIFFTPRQASRSKQPARPTAPVNAPEKGAAKRKKGPAKRTPPYVNEMIRLQKTVEPQIPRSSFMRLVREIMQNSSSQDLRLTVEALEALRESAEMYVVQALGDAYLITISRNQVTLQARDLQLLMLLRGR